jgi:transposase
VDLTLVGGKWYLAIACDVPDPDKVGIEDILGVDLGVVNLPLTANTGAGIAKVRSRYALRRALL